MCNRENIKAVSTLKKNLVIGKTFHVYAYVCIWTHIIFSINKKLL